jgi:DHA2 family multidrug resistance protein
VLPLLLTFFIGKYAARFDLRWLASLSFLAMAAASFIYSGFNLEVNFWHVAMVQLFLGLGVAFFFMPILTVLLSDLRTDEIASGSGVATFLRTIGGSFAASVVTLFWTHRASIHHARLAEHISAYNPTATHAMNAMGGSTGSLERINQMITVQGLQISFNEIFHVLGWLFLSLVVIVWFTKPPFIASGKPEPSGESVEPRDDTNLSPESA